MSQKFLLMEIPATEEVAHVVILTPLMVFIIVQLFTMTPSKDFKIEIPIDRPICIPSVLGLSSVQLC
ncbi:hypothetical protein Csa_020386 [Cucumis sativus]|uniref:Uncharacterized protein n=1 Tax=Cucumis sativus TaxID=3659 RepID=A0A0A0K385_CUCSA|nr:hypothetical protein Csa_020386 [Cucumis sativus]